MTEIERKALALVNEVTFGDEPWTLDDVRGGFVFKALCRAIEQHEAFRQEVSDAVESCIMRLSKGRDGLTAQTLARFIIPKPDPLVEIADEMKETYCPTNVSWAQNIRQAIEARGGKIVWEGE